jgi:hypothetical protein
METFLRFGKPLLEQSGDKPMHWIVIGLLALLAGLWYWNQLRKQVTQSGLLRLGRRMVDYVQMYFARRR